MICTQVGGNHARARRARHQHIQSELERSVGEFVANEDGRVVARKLFGAELRDSAIFVIDGRLFATEKFIASSKKRGHAIMLASTCVEINQCVGCARAGSVER